MSCVSLPCGYLLTKIVSSSHLDGIALLYLHNNKIDGENLDHKDIPMSL